MKKLQITLIDEWRHCWKLYSVWIFAFLMAAPELYNAAISAGLISQEQVPGVFSKLMSLVSFVGLVSRVVSQKKATISELPPEEQAEVALGTKTLEEAVAEHTKPLVEVVVSEPAPPAAPAEPAPAPAPVKPDPFAAPPAGQ